MRTSDVVKSLTDAQANIGEEVNEAYIIKEDTDIYNIPSNAEDGASMTIGAVQNSDKVFVQRRTYDGWYLVYSDGVVGWIPPESAEVATEEVEVIPVFDEFKKGYAAGDKNEGVKIYASYDAKEHTAIIPECVEVDIAADKDGYWYVLCDYASGWVKKENIADVISDALSAHPLEKPQKYKTKEASVFMSLPTRSFLCKSEKILDAEPGTEYEVTRIVTTEKEKWGYTVIGGKSGWINLENSERQRIALVILVWSGGLLLAAGIAFFVYWQRKKILYLIHKITKFNKISKNS